MADGSINFSTNLDNSDLDKQLKRAESKVDSLKKKLESDTDKRTLIENAMDRSEAAIHDTEAAIDSLKQRLETLNAEKMGNPASFVQSRAEIDQITSKIAEQEGILQRQIKDQDKLGEKWQAQNDVVELTAGKLDQARQKQDALGASAQQAAAEQSAAFANASSRVNSLVSGMSARVKSGFASVAASMQSPFDTLEKKIVGAFKKVFVFTVIVKSVRAIKSEISSMASGNDKFVAGVENLKAVLKGFLSQIVQAVLPGLTAFANMLGGLFERIAGLIDSIFGTNIIGSIQEQREAASAAIQASNDKLESKYSKKVTAQENKQAKAAKKLAKEQEKANSQIMGFDEINAMTAKSSAEAASAAEDIAEPDYTNDWTKGFMPDAGMLQGVLDWFDQIRNRIFNDMIGPFAKIREGLEQIKTGWDEVVHGFLTGDFGLIWAGFKDIVVGALKVIEGAFGALMDWLDEMTGGRFHDIFEGLKTIVHGAVEFIDGLLSLDVAKMLSGLKTMLSGLVQFLKGILDAALGLVKTVVGGIFDWLGDKIPAIKPLLEFVESTVFGVVDGVKDFIDGALDFIFGLVGGVFDLIVGLITGDGSAIVNGIKSICYGILSLIEGAVNGILDIVFGLLNGIIGGINIIPGVDIPELERPTFSIPRLATGAVIPPNREFMAVLGDQKRGTNIETPESLMRQVVREEAGALIADAMLAMSQGNGGGDVHLVLRVGSTTLAEAVSKGNADLMRQGRVKPELAFGI